MKSMSIFLVPLSSSLSFLFPACFIPLMFNVARHNFFPTGMRDIGGCGSCAGASWGGSLLLFLRCILLAHFLFIVLCSFLFAKASVLLIPLLWFLVLFVLSMLSPGMAVFGLRRALGARSWPASPREGVRFGAILNCVFCCSVLIVLKCIVLCCSSSLCIYVMFCIYYMSI